MGFSILSESRTRVPIKSFNIRDALRKAATSLSITKSYNDIKQSLTPTLHLEGKKKHSIFAGCKILHKPSSILLSYSKFQGVFPETYKSQAFTLPSTLSPIKMDRKSSIQYFPSLFQSKSQKINKKIKKNTETFDAVIRNEKAWKGKDFKFNASERRNKGILETATKKSARVENREKKKRILARIPQPVMFEGELGV